MLSEEIRLKPAMQPYWLAMGDIENQLEKIEDTLKELPYVVFSPHSGAHLLQQCEKEIQLLEEKRDRIIQPLLSAAVEIADKMNAVIDVYKKCAEILKSKV
jgi:uncharacterized protein Yka (UPF0111/DUF47 family)